ncbi:uncharacterized protein BJ212DRAFT_1480886 [Suillus subaureus]|uniref:Uncharacterized protein n=1 Tax=Suillus subaureus TaxID=48587 RepID=A0A9P7EBP4_9AGAM|nr:uncharacterized protein BJ212DRAFT_1480886 [Suillus subaureus]KAG1816439.1 hypothetical protein BJ212DRAFT_1480886 [Suillus subaureus]
MSMEDEEDKFAHSRFRDHRVILTKHPHQLHQNIFNIMENHACKGFKKDLTTYLNTQLAHSHSHGQLRDMSLPFSHIDIYHGFKFCLDSLGNDIDFDQMEEADIVKAQPSISHKAACFDTVVVMDEPDCESTGLTGE